MARIFDGIDDYLEITDHADLDVGTGDFTIVIWNRSTASQASDARIFNKGGAIRYEAGNLNVGSMSFVVDDDNIKNQANYNSVTELEDGLWHMWTFEHDVGTALKIFLDGDNEKASAGGGTVLSLDNSDSLIIGKGGPLGGPEWKGELSGFALIKRVLTGAEKDAIFKIGNARRLSTRPSIDLPLWGLHSPEIDLSGGGHTATVNGPTVVNGPPITPFTPKWSATVPLIETSDSATRRIYLDDVLISIPA